MPGASDAKVAMRATTADVTQLPALQACANALGGSGTVGSGRRRSLAALSPVAELSGRVTPAAARAGDQQPQQAHVAEQMQHTDPHMLARALALAGAPTAYRAAARVAGALARWTAPSAAHGERLVSGFLGGSADEAGE